MAVERVKEVKKKKKNGGRTRRISFAYADWLLPVRHSDFSGTLIVHGVGIWYTLL